MGPHVIQTRITTKRFVHIFIHLPLQSFVMCNVSLNSVMVKCERSHWFHPLKCGRFDDSLLNNKGKQLQFIVKPYLGFNGFYNGNQLLSLLWQESPLLFIVLEQCWESSSSDLIWKLCANVYLFPLSLLYSTEQPDSCDCFSQMLKFKDCCI